MLATPRKRRLSGQRWLATVLAITGAAIVGQAARGSFCDTSSPWPASADLKVSQMAGHRFCKLPYDLLSRRDLTPAAKLIYAYLLDKQGHNQECWPGQRTIATELGICRESVIRAVGELKAVKLLVVSGGHRDGPRHSRACRYRVLDGPEPGSPNGTESVPLEQVNGTESRPLNGTESVPLQKPTVRNPDRQRYGNRTVNGTESRPDPDFRLQTRPKGGVGGGSTAGLFGDNAPSPPPRHAPRTWPAKVLEDIYSAYPRKRAPAEARRAIAKALQRLSDRNLSEEPAAWLLARVRLYAEYRKGCEPHKTPFPATWLNQDRFDEDVADWRSDQRAELEGASEGDAGPGSGYREIIAKAIKNQPVLEPPEGCEPDGL